MNILDLFEGCPNCGGPIFANQQLAEKKDACYRKVRSRYKVWPSAYASGALVQCRKKGADNWGNKSKGVTEALPPVAAAAAAVARQQAVAKGAAQAVGGATAGNAFMSVADRVGAGQSGETNLSNIQAPESLEQGNAPKKLKKDGRGAKFRKQSKQQSVAEGGIPNLRKVMVPTVGQRVIADVSGYGRFGLYGTEPGVIVRIPSPRLIKVRIDKDGEIYDFGNNELYQQGVAEGSDKTFTVVYYSKKTDRNVTKPIKASSESELWARLRAKGIDVISVEEQGVAEGNLRELAPNPGGGDGGGGDDGDDGFELPLDFKGQNVLVWPKNKKYSMGDTATPFPRGERFTGKVYIMWDGPKIEAIFYLDPKDREDREAEYERVYGPQGRGYEDWLDHKWYDTTTPRYRFVTDWRLIPAKEPGGWPGIVDAWGQDMKAEVMNHAQNFINDIIHNDGDGRHFVEPKQSVAEGSLNEFAPGDGSGEGRWYTDDQMIDMVGPDWAPEDDAGHLTLAQRLQDAQAWLDDQGYSVAVEDVQIDPDGGYRWKIYGEFYNPRFAKKDQGVAEGSVWSSADQKMKHHSEFPHTHTAVKDIRSSMTDKIIVPKGARLSALGNDNYLNLDTGVQPFKLDPTSLVKQGVAETSDYFRRREREEAIISGQKPARKKQPAQTSDYARRREQEKKAEKGVAEAGPFSHGAKKPRKGSVAHNAEVRRKEQGKNKQPIEPKDQMVGTAKVTKGVAEMDDPRHIRYHQVYGDPGENPQKRSYRGPWYLDVEGSILQDNNGKPKEFWDYDDAFQYAVKLTNDRKQQGQPLKYAILIRKKPIVPQTNQSDDFAEDIFMGVKDPVVVVTDKKTGKYLDKLKLSAAVNKYQLGSSEAVKKQLANQDYTYIGNYTIAAPIGGQTMGATISEDSVARLKLLAGTKKI